MRKCSVRFFKTRKIFLNHHSWRQTSSLVIAGLFVLLMFQNVTKQKDVTINHDRMSPLIFIGGFPRSGTTLMRAMLDAHPLVRCGQETRVLPKILALKENVFSRAIEKNRLYEAGITEDLMTRATAAFLLQIIAEHGESAPRLCSKDPYLLLYTQFLSKVFPQSKIIFMVRDGRASIYSTISRNVTISEYDLSSPRDCLRRWSRTVSRMFRQCLHVGPTRCLMVHYEQLVLHPEEQLRRILSFLDLPWDENVLHHDQLINVTGGVRISRYEKSSDQIIKPVNTEALSKWVGFYPDDVVEDMETIAPMLEVLGYDPRANPPDYGIPDEFVQENTRLVQQNAEIWKEKVQQLQLVHG